MSRRAARRRALMIKRALILGGLVLILALVVYLFIKYSPGTEKADLDKYFNLKAEDDVGVVWQGELSETVAKKYDDRIYIEFDPEQNTDGGKLSWKGSGGITVKNGVIYAGKVTKPNKPATLTISCGKTKGKITVVVTD